MNIGEKFHLLTVIDSAPPTRYRHTQWLCQCECGNTAVVRQEALLRGRVKSCGCLTHIATRKAIKACTLHGESKTRLHGIMMGITNRLIVDGRPQKNKLTIVEREVHLNESHPDSADS